MNYKNGFFQLEHREDGTYIKIFPAMNGGTPLQIEEVAAYLHNKKIQVFDIKGLNDAISKATQPTSFCVIEEQVLPENEYLNIMIDKDKTKVVGRFYPPSSKGKLITKEEILSDLQHRGIKHGIIEKNIDIYLKGRQFCTSMLLAKATPPTPGKDAVITYHFNTAPDIKPKINEDGTVDFHQLDNINHIEEGALLATLEPADLGKPGIDVFGGETKQPKVSVKVLKHGKKIKLSEDGTKMYSEVAGHVSLTEDTVFVSDTYEVPADVGSATGDITYDGNVVVKGNILTGYKVEAKGDIIVYGVVEGAELIAGGQIVLKRGIKGMGRGTLKAGGDIVTKFIENSEVIAGANVSTDAIINSKVSAKGDVVATGKRGLITGSDVQSETLISLKTAGSTMATKTSLTIGADESVIEENKNLEKMIAEMNTEKTKFEQIVSVYQKKITQGEKLPADRLKQYKIAVQSIKILESNIQNAENRIGALRSEMEKYNNGRIKVYDLAYVGVKIVISNAIYHVKSEMHRCQFIKERAEIKMMLV